MGMRRIPVAIIGLALAMLGSIPALADTPEERLQILAKLVGVETNDGILVRKLMSPVTFLLYTSGQPERRFGSLRSFFSELSTDTDDFLRDTLGTQYQGQPARQATIMVEVAYPPQTNEKTAEEWFDGFFPTPAEIEASPEIKDSYLGACFGTVQNLAYRNPTQPTDAFDVITASTDATIIIKGAGFEKNEARRCYYRHLMGALGLRGAVPDGYESVLSESEPALRPTKFDRWLVKTLYESKGDPGTAMTVAFPQLAQ